MTEKQDGWHVGARVFIAERGYGRNNPEFWATVTKVGRKWVEYQSENQSWRDKHDRFDAETMRTDAFNSAYSGTVFYSEDEYHASLEAQKAWDDFVQKLPRQAPAHLTAASIAKLNEMVFP